MELRGRWDMMDQDKDSFPFAKQTACRILAQSLAPSIHPLKPTLFPVKIDRHTPLPHDPSRFNKNCLRLAAVPHRLSARHASETRSFQDQEIRIQAL